MPSLSSCAAGCSAICWQTANGLHLFGRNLDFHTLTKDSQVLSLPRGMQYHISLTPGRPGPPHSARYPSAGIGLMAGSNAPVLYEGLNAAGLMGAQLYYRGFAHYRAASRPGREAVQPPFLVFHLLSQCAGINEAVRLLEEGLDLVALPLFGTVPPLHWIFTDSSGESIIVEPDRDGLHIYRNTLGVMTNSPGYPWHRLNLLNFAGIRDLDYDSGEIAGEQLEQCFSGSGAQGLPGDFSSPSRFVRLAFLKHFALKGRQEEEGVARLFRLLQNVAFPLGMVRVSQLEQAYDYTIYTAVMCAESGRFYWTSYDDMQLQCLELSRPSALAGHPLSFPLCRQAERGIPLTGQQEPPRA